MTDAPADRRHLYQTIALVASALGLFVACGLGARPSIPAGPPPPRANLSISAETLIFGPTVVKTQSPTQQVVFTNNDIEPLTFSYTEDLYKRTFHIDSNTCVGAIPRGSSCTLTFSFRPRRPGRFYTAIDFYIRDRSPATVRLEGEGIPAPKNP